MAELVIDNTVQIRLIWSLSAQDWAVNVLHGIKKAALEGVDQGDADTLKTNIATQFSGSTLKGQLGTPVGLSRVGIRDLDSANNLEYISSFSGLSGSSTSELLPLQTALCCTLRTGKAGRSYRGRYYQSGYTEGFGNAGSAAAAVQTALAAWVTDLQEALDASGYTLAVASRKLGRAEPVENIVVRDVAWDTQRRRTDKAI